MRLLSDHIQASLRERLEQYDRWEREISLRKGASLVLDIFSPVRATKP
jgi:hypothetical protein